MFEIYVPFYNSVFCAEYQMKTLKTFIRDDDVQIIFIDNNMGRHPKASAGLAKICNEHDIPLIVNEDAHCEQLQQGIEESGLSTSDKLGWTLNLIWTFAKQRNAEYFGFLDQDCFAFKPTRLKEYLDKNGAYGKVVPTHPSKEQHQLPSGEWIWNLHVMANFFKSDFLLEKEEQGIPVNFMPGSWGKHFDKMPVTLDVGGMNWEGIWREQDRMKFVLPEEHYFYFDDLSLLDPTGEHPTRVLYEILDNKWIHMVHGANSAESSDYVKPKTSYIKGFLDLALLNESAAGAAPRDTFMPTYRDPNPHEAFTSNADD